MGVLLVVFAAIVCGIMMQKKGNYDTREVGSLLTFLCIILCVILVTIVILCAITVNANTLKAQLEYETLCSYKDNPFADGNGSGMSGRALAVQEQGQGDEGAAVEAAGAEAEGL